MDSETKIISIHSGKGGVGKTTIVANLGAQLAARGNSTLVIDSDFFTRGLTFLLSKDELHSKVGYLDILHELSANHERMETGSKANSTATFDRYHLVAPNLYLLPPTHQRATLIRERKKGSEDFGSVLKDLPDLAFVSRSAFREFFREFRFVLIDCRSGTDKVAIAPASLADQFWLVLEEDNTSIRASNFLLDSIEQHASSCEVQADEPKFGGFIVNMIVSPRPQFLAKSLERIFGGRCLAVAPLSRRAREAFIHDRLVSNSRPHDPVSREVRAMANRILEGSTESSVDRLTRLDQRDRLLRFSLAFVFFLIPMIAAFLLFFLPGFSFEFFRQSQIIMLMIGLLGAAAGAGFAALFYLRR